MKKKKYMKPQTEVMKIEKTLLVSGSIGGSASEPAHSRGYDDEY